MDRIRRSCAGIAGLAVVAAVGVLGAEVSVASATPGRPATSSATAMIEGSGSSWASNAVYQWIADVQSNGLRVGYVASGTSQGKADYANNTTDFAVADVPYLGTDPVSGNVDTSNGREYGTVPLVGGGLTFPYHLEVGGKRVTNLRLSGSTLAGIFTNKIRNWDNAAITKDNNGRRFPSLPIIPVVHSEGSGASYNVTDYFAQQYTDQWSAFAYDEGATEYFPLKAPQVAENGSDSVVNFIGSSTANGSIGYDEYTYALGRNLPVASVENKAGYFVGPNQYSVAIALRNVSLNTDTSSPAYLDPNYDKVFTSSDRRAYPLSFYSSMLVPTSATDARVTTTAKRQTLADFAYYSICAGQREAGPLGYAPLPLNLVKAGLSQIARLHDADSAVDLSGMDLAGCDNPTFLAGDPTQDHLGKIAPEPPACDRATQNPCGWQAHTALHITLSRHSLHKGARRTISGRLSGPGAPPQALVDLQRRLAGGHWTTLRSKVTSAAGTVTFVLKPARSAHYRLHHAATAEWAASTSPSRHVTVTH